MSGQNVPEHYYTEYARNIQHLLQQRQSKFSALVDYGTHSGEKASPVDQIGSGEMQDITTRFAPMGRIDLPAARRWVFPVFSDFPQLLDSFDALKLLTDPKSKYVEAAHMAGHRRKDRHIIGGFFADAKTGVAAAGTESFGTGLTTDATPGQNVSVSVGGTTSGMNAAKLKEGLRRLEEAEVDTEVEQPYCGLTSKQHTNLLNEIEIVSMDFNNKAVLVDGKVKRWLGIEFVRSQLLQTGTDNAAGTSRMCPLWVKNGMHYGDWEALTTKISERNDLQGIPWQAYVKLGGGATRLELQRVVRIWCRE